MVEGCKWAGAFLPTHLPWKRGVLPPHLPQVPEGRTKRIILLEAEHEIRLSNGLALKTHIASSDQGKLDDLAQDTERFEGRWRALIQLSSTRVDGNALAPGRLYQAADIQRWRPPH